MQTYAQMPLHTNSNMKETVFTIAADQWGEHGYIYRDGMVMQYETDRKEQTHMQFSARPVQEVIADEATSVEVREWLLVSVVQDRNSNNPIQPPD